MNLYHNERRGEEGRGGDGRGGESWNNTFHLLLIDMRGVKQQWIGGALTSNCVPSFQFTPPFTSATCIQPTSPSFPSHLDLVGIKVLNSGSWARSSERIPVSLPVSLEDFIPLVEEFYKAQHCGRKLTWHHLMSNGAVSA